MFVCRVQVVDKGLRQLLAVDEDCVTCNLHLVARQTNNALDVILFNIVGIVKDEDFAAVRCAQLVCKLVHQHKLPLIEVGLHGVALNAVVLHDLANHQEEDERKHNRLDELAQQRTCRKRIGSACCPRRTVRRYHTLGLQLILIARLVTQFCHMLSRQRGSCALTQITQLG